MTDSLSDNSLDVSSQPASNKPGQTSILKAAGLIAVVTVLSKILGFVRDWAIAYIYGTSLQTDAYFAAFQIPSFAIVLLGGLGGPFHTTTVAVFSKLINGSDEPTEQAKQLVASLITATGVVSTIFAILCFLFAEPILRLLLPGASNEMIHIATTQMQIMSPVVLIGGLIGIFYGVLNIYNVFFWPSFSPTALSLVMLLMLWLSPKDPTASILAWATLGGALAQFLCQLPDFFKHKFTMKPNFDWHHPEIKQIREMLFPATIGTTIGQLMTYVDMFFTSTLRMPGAWAAITYSNRLVQFPIGILQTALLVPIFPRFSRLVADQNWPELRRNFSMGVIALWFISIPILVIIILLTEPLIRITFQHGNFTAENTVMVSQALIFQAFQMVPYFARDSITRVFYAFEDSKTPLMVGMLAIGLKALLLAFLTKPFGIGGITLSTTLITIINMCLLGYLSKRHVADLGFKKMLTPFLKLTAAGMVMAAIMVLAQDALTVMSFSFIPGPRWQELLRLAIVSAAGMFVYTVTALSFKVDEAQYLFDRFRGMGEQILGRFKRRFARY